MLTNIRLGIVLFITAIYPFVLYNNVSAIVSFELLLIALSMCMIILYFDREYDEINKSYIVIRKYKAMILGALLAMSGVLLSPLILPIILLYFCGGVMNDDDNKT